MTQIKASSLTRKQYNKDAIKEMERFDKNLKVAIKNIPFFLLLER